MIQLLLSTLLSIEEFFPKSWSKVHMRPAALQKPWKWLHDLAHPENINMLKNALLWHHVIIPWWGASSSGFLLPPSLLALSTNLGIEKMRRCSWRQALCNTVSSLKAFSVTDVWLRLAGINSTSRPSITFHSSLHFLCSLPKWKKRRRSIWVPVRLNRLYTCDMTGWSD